MRIAAFQRFPIFDDGAAVIDRLLSDLSWADQQGVQLALFPECHLLGHSYEDAVVKRRAIRTGGAIWQELLTRLEPISTAAIIGNFERHDHHITNSALLIEAGRVTGRYAKAYPNECGVTAGEDFPVFIRSGLRFGINICNDANYSAPAQHLAAKGAKLICYPLNNIVRPATAEAWRTRSVSNLTARARQTGCWVMSADVAGNVGQRVSYGCTMIVSPEGEIVARSPEGAEGVAVFDLPRDERTRWLREPAANEDCGFAGPGFRSTHDCRA